MKRPVLVQSRPATAFTLVEILVATTLSLVILGAVIAMFGNVGQSVTNSRAMLEAADRLRVAEARLQLDLAGVTVTMDPPRRPENNEGYFEYIEGPVNATTASTVAQNTDENPATADTTVGDFDDILMFTTRTAGRPFVGKFGGGTVQSDVAEVAWFLRGRTLHRRVLLVVPGAALPGSTANFYRDYDVSAHLESGAPVANTLGDLTRRECRFAHYTSSSNLFPYAIPWSWATTNSGYTFPTLPTLNECSATGWLPSTDTAGPIPSLDFWTNDPAYRVSDSALAGPGTRVSDDIILTNVIGFDVKAWDPNVPGYVDLGAGARFAAGNIYDTWSTSYYGNTWNNGLDDGDNGIVDDDNEKSNLPPYPYPLRGVQVKIRIFEPDSRQIREVTVVQDFLP